MNDIEILAGGLAFPEGPAFDARGRLWAVELQGGNLVCLDERGLTRIPVGGAPNGIAIDARDRVLFCDAGENAIRRHDPESGETVILAATVAGQPLNKPNDLAFDAAGNLVFTCPGDSRREPTGYVCLLPPGGPVRKIAAGLYFPNGLAFTPDGRRLVIAETYRQRLWIGDWDGANWTAPRVFAEVGGAPGPDGLAFAADGRLYVAVFGSGLVKELDAEGNLIAGHAVGGQRPTNCAFAPAGRSGLVVSEAETGVLLNLPWAGSGAPLFAGDLP